MTPNLGLIYISFFLFFGINFVKSNNGTTLDGTGYTPVPTSKNELSGFCDFIKKECAWNSTGIWRWHSGTENSLQLNGPPVKGALYKYVPLVADFTLDQKNPKILGTEYLTSPEFQTPQIGAVCFVFEYYTYLSDNVKDGLTLYLVDPDDEKKITPIWARGNSGVDDWLEAKVNVITNSSYKLQFEAYGRLGYVALQKFSLINGYCNKAGDLLCDFEAGMCRGWTTDGQPEGTEAFSIQQAQMTNFKNKIDHTSHSGFGRFAYAIGPPNSGKETHVRLISPEWKNLMKQCFRFSFMKSSDEVVLKMSIKFSGNDSYVDLWKSDFTHRIDEWSTFQKTMIINDPIKIILEADFSTKSMLSIDDISLNPYSCNDLINCTFKHEACGWEANRQKTLQWSLGTGRVEIAEKLKPNSLVFYQYSTVLYTDFTTLNVGEKDTMEHLSPYIQPDSKPESGKCFQLELKVSDIGDDDDLTLEQIDSTDNRKLLWSWKDSKRKPSAKWIEDLYIFVPNLPSNGPYRLSLAATSSNSYTRIGVEKFELINGYGRCAGLPGVSTIPTLPSTPSTTTKSDLESPICDFEGNKECAWKSSPAPNNFIVSSPSKIIDVPGRFLPHTDHTGPYYKGHFAYAFNSKKSGHEDIATFSAPWPTVESSRPGICIDFAYYYYTAGGENGATLTADNSLGQKIIWRAGPGISNKWHTVRFTFEPGKGSKFKMTYDSLTFRTRLLSGLLALDDIKVSSGPCTPSTTTTEQIYDFEDGTSFLEPIANSDSITMNIYAAGPALLDHTTRSSSGHFYGLNFTDIPAKITEVENRIVSQTDIFSAEQNQPKCFKFSYYMSGIQNDSTFGYEIYDGSLLIKKWEVSGITNSLWLTQSIPVTHFTFKYRIQFFIRITNLNRGSSIFIDDLTLSPAECQEYGCDFKNGDTCSLEPIPIDRHVMEEDIAKHIAKDLNVGDTLANEYMNQYVKQLFHVYSPTQDRDTMDIPYPTVTSTGFGYGNFLLMIAEDNYERAIFITEKISFNPNQNSFCLSFWVAKPSQADAVLQVFQGDSYAGNKLIFKMMRASSAKGSIHKLWEKVSLEIEKKDANDLDAFFYFVGTIGNGDRKSFIAIDEYEILPKCLGPINNPKPTDAPATNPSGNTVTWTTQIPNGKFKCDDGTLISSDLLCDNYNNCDNGEDELLCGTCTFSKLSGNLDHDMCGYVKDDSETPGFVWQFSDQVNKIPGEFGKGYLTAVNNHQVKFDEESSKLVAVIESPIIHGAFSDCYVSFSYRANGSSLDKNAFQFYILNKDVGSKTILYENTFDIHSISVSDDQWKMITLHFGRVLASFKLGFRGEIGSNDFNSHSLNFVAKKDCTPPRPSSTCDGFRCQNNVCILKEQQCDYEDNCGDMSDEKDCDSRKMTNFQDGFGLWTARSATQNGYAIKSVGEFKNYRMGPMYDHTYGIEGLNGKVAIFKQTAETKSTSIAAELVSPYFKFNTNCKLRFYWFKNNHAPITVILRDMANPEENIILVQIEEFYSSWVKEFPQKLAYSAEVGHIYQVIIAASLPTSRLAGSKLYSSYIALDDLSWSDECDLLPSDFVPTLPTLPDGSTQTYAPGICPGHVCKNTAGKDICLKIEQICDFHQDCNDNSDEINCGTCDFNDGRLCGWDTTTEMVYWTTVKPARDSEEDCPKVDGSGNSLGGYGAIYSQNTDRFKTLRTSGARMISPPINSPTSPYCTFIFSFYSNNGAKLSVFKNVANEPVELIKLAGEATKGWTNYSISIGKQDKGLQLEVLGFANTRYNFLMDIFVDDFKFENCAPDASPTANESVSCDFEKSHCGWINVKAEDSKRDSDWSRISSNIVEPGNDHTSLLLPPRLPRLSLGTWLGIGTIFSSRTDYVRTALPLAAKQDYCFTFWYYLMGPSSDSRIALYQGISTNFPDYIPNSKNFTLLWERDTARERNWLQATVQIAANDSEQYLLFRGSAGPDSVLALDDFVLTTGLCPDLDIGESCSFDSGLCGWEVHEKDWHREIGKMADHTTHSYKGAVLKADYSSSNESVIEIDVGKMPYLNDTIMESRFSCIEFYYNIQTAQSIDSEEKTMIGVRSFRRDHPYERKETNVTGAEVLNADQIGEWSLMTMDTYLYRDSTIQIFAKFEKSNTQIFIDDVVWTGYCLQQPNCDFEKDFCGWSNGFPYTEQFIRFQPNSKWEKGLFVKADTTTKSSDGHYAILAKYGSSPVTQNLKSPLIQAKSSVVCFSFYYFGVTSDEKPLFKVELIDLTHPIKKSGIRPQKYIYVNYTENINWSHFKHEFRNLPHYYRINIILNTVTGYESDIGIDDISALDFSCEAGKPTKSPPPPESENILNCDFEKDNCNWKPSPDLGWTVGSYDAQSDKYAPRIDHTKGTEQGKYAMVHLKEGINKYSLISTRNMSWDRDRCLTFWYYEDGETKFDIEIYQDRLSFSTFLNRYKSSLETRCRWSMIKTSVEVPIVLENQTMRFRIQYSFYKNGNTYYDRQFAIDDISITPGRCSHEVNYVYNFETSDLEDLDLENIRPIASRAASVVKPSAGHSYGIPSVDHTIGTSDGSYFLFRPDPSYNKGSFFQSTLSILNLEPDFSGARCIRFAYQRSRNVTLKIFALAEHEFNYDYEHYTTSLLWHSRYQTRKDQWEVVEVSKQKFYEHKLVFFMSAPPSFSSFLALDDISILNRKCSAPIDCDFQSYCSYSPMTKKDNLNFGIFTGSADDASWPGPRFDHTTKGAVGGGYLYLTSYRSTKSDGEHSAGIISGPREVQAGQSYCLSLFIQLSTVDLSLKLSLVRIGSDYSEDNDTVSIGSIENVKQTSWTSWGIKLDDSNIGTAVQIQLVIEGTLGSNSKGAIAIDDIFISSGACPSGIGNGKGGDNTALVCPDGKQLNASQICNFFPDCEGGFDEIECGTCDFETDTCGWKNMTKSLPGFSWWKAGTIKKSNAPIKDGSGKADGHYMLAEFSGNSASATSDVATNYGQKIMYFKQASRTCVMVFDYYMKASDKLSLSVRVGADTSDLSTIYRILKPKTDQVWRKAYAHIAHRYAPFFVDISAHSSISDVIAFDNVNFVNCSLPPPKSSCDTSEFQCTQNRFCISLDSVCDFVADCGPDDESDEAVCDNLAALRCNFEGTLYACRITEETKNYNNGRWMLYSPRGNTFSFGSRDYEPSIDNTFGTPYGHFYKLAPGFNAKDSTQAQFSTGMMTSKAGKMCKLRFFYYIADSSDTLLNNKLEIRIRYAAKQDPEPNALQTITLDASAEVQQRWNKAVVSLSYTSSFQVIFQGYISSSASISVDDITFEGCQLSDSVPASELTTTVMTTIVSTDEPEPTTERVTTEESATKNPRVKNKDVNHSPGHGGTIVAGILIPLFIISVAIGAFIWFRKHQQRFPRDDTFSFSNKRFTGKDK